MGQTLNNIISFQSKDDNIMKSDEFITFLTTKSIPPWREKTLCRLQVPSERIPVSGKLLGQIRWLWNLPNKLFGDYNTNFSEATFLLEFGLLGRPQLSLVLFYSKKEVGANWMWCQCFDIFLILIFSLSLSTKDWSRCEARSALNVMPVLWYVLNNYFFTFTFY